MSETLVDPWSLPPPKAKERTVLVTDACQPGITMRIALRQLFVAQTLAAQSMAENYIAEYIDGTDEAPPVPFMVGPPGQAERAPLNEALVRNLCHLAAMEAEPRRYGFEGFLGIALRMPTGFMRLSQAAALLNRGLAEEETEERPGNFPRPNGADGNVETPLKTPAAGSSASASGTVGLTPS